jgi:thiaminase (transcriptional activator TenA)
MPSARELWDSNVDIAAACLEHPFVQGIASGRLDRRAFARYVAQDAIFLESFARAYALCIAKAPTRHSMEAAKALLDGVFDELDLHASYAAKWHVDLSTAPAAATSAYADFLQRVAALEPVAHAYAAMTPCMRLYAWLGHQLVPITKPDSPYAVWVTTYSAPEFDELAATLERLLDNLGPAGDAATMTAHYRAAMRLELEFFDAMYRNGA